MRTKNKFASLPLNVIEEILTSYHLCNPSGAIDDITNFYEVNDEFLETLSKSKNSVIQEMMNKFYEEMAKFYEIIKSLP